MELAPIHVLEMGVVGGPVSAATVVVADAGDIDSATTVLGVNVIAAMAWAESSRILPDLVVAGDSAVAATRVVGDVAAKAAEETVARGASVALVRFRHVELRVTGRVDATRAVVEYAALGYDCYSMQTDCTAAQIAVAVAVAVAGGGVADSAIAAIDRRRDSRTAAASSSSVAAEAGADAVAEAVVQLAHTRSIAGEAVAAGYMGCIVAASAAHIAGHGRRHSDPGEEVGWT